jgi:hypothetical protein
MYKQEINIKPYRPVLQSYLTDILQDYFLKFTVAQNVFARSDII